MKYSERAIEESKSKYWCDQRTIYNFFENPNDICRWVYHYPLALLFLVCFILHSFIDEGTANEDLEKVVFNLGKF